MTQPGSEQDSEYQLSETQRPAPLGHWAWDVASGAGTWSDELYRILNVCAAENTPSYEAFFRRLHPAHRARAEAMVQATFVDGRPCAFDSPLSLADGPERWIRSTCAADVDAAGAPVRMHGTVQEIPIRMDAGASLDEGGAGLRDPLTGLADWQHFADRAAAVLDGAARNGDWSTALLVVDIDRFHRVTSRPAGSHPCPCGNG